MIRKPVVAGKFYAMSKNSLREEVSAFIDEYSEKEENVIGIVSPHAGFIYSGSVAGAVFSRVMIPDTVIIVGPNHTGFGDTVSIMSSGVWEMPQGNVIINEELAKFVKEGSSIIRENEKGHRDEHSVEVQIPFIQYVKERFDIVPITMMFMDYKSCIEVGKAISAAIQKFGKPVLIIASSDMSHYVSRITARKKDRLAIDRILELDPRGLYNTVKKNSISMCGVLPVTVMLTAAIDIGAEKGELIKYSDSGYVSNDTENVVGYAGLIVKKQMRQVEQ